MDKKLREDLKHDKFVEEVGHTVEYLADHKEMVRKYGGIAVAVLVIGGVIWGFLSYQKSQRQEALRQATLVLDAYVGDQSPSGGLAFPTQVAKDAAALKAFSEVAAKHSGSKEGDLARFYTGTLYCDQGKVAECEAAFKQAGNGGDANTASLAKLSLGNLYLSQGKLGEAETVFRQLVANPTPVVSKEQAQIGLARSIMKSKAAEARMILESLQALDRPAVTRAAVAVLGEMLGNGQIPQNR